MYTIIYSVIIHYIIELDELHKRRKFNANRLKIIKKITVHLYTI